METNFIQINGIMSEGYGFSPKVVMRDTRLTIESKAIYAYMSSFAGAGLSSFPSISLQLSELKISKTRYYKHRKLLEDLGYITIKQTRTKNKNGKEVASKNIYTLEQFPISKIIKNNESELPQNKEADESIDNTQLSVFPQNEDTQNAYIQNKDNNSNSIKSNSIKSNSIKSSSSVDDEEKIKALLSISQKCNYKVKRDTIEKLLLIYDYTKIAKAIVTASTMSTDIRDYDKYLLATLNSIDKQNVTNIVSKDKESKQDVFNNYEQRSYDFNDLEKKLLGWE